MTTFKLARWFSDHGLEVSVFSFELNGHIEQDFARLLTPKHDGGVKHKRNLSSLGNAVACICPDVVINQMPYEHDIGAVLAKEKSYLLLGCLRNSLYSVKGNIDSYAANVLPKFAVRFFRNAVGRQALWHVHKMRHRKDLQRILSVYDRFVMFAPPNLGELREFVPESKESQICLIPNSVPSVVDELPAKEKRILWLGRLDYYQKRADLIVPFWELLAPVLPDWHLDVVGDGPVLDELKKSAQSKGLERLTFHGRQEPDSYFKVASIFVMTSAYEGFPNVLIEAQSYGCVPVVFDSYPVASWVINNGIDGFLEQPFDLTSLCRRVAKISESPDLQRLMANAIENARRFNIDRIGPMWISLFESLVTESCEGKSSKNLE